MTRVVVCSAAEQDYAESLEWYAKRSVDAANAYDDEFDLALAAIASDPQRYPRCDDRHHFYLMKRFPFRIIYRIGDNGIVVIAVAHSSRHPRFWSDR